MSRLAEIITLAQRLATDAHRLQTRKGGALYISHPAAVAAAVPDELKPIAWLHDVLEDTKTTAADLTSAGMPDYVVIAVQLLTKTKGEDYAVYLERIGRNDHARRVKIADVRHNLSDQPSEKNRLKYQQALLSLGADVDRGPP